MIRCVAFDFDGTLVDSNAIKRQAFFEIALEHDPDGDWVRSLLEGPGPNDRHSMTRAMADAFAGEVDADAVESLADNLLAEFGSITHRGVVACPEINGASAALAFLVARKLPIYLNTATPMDAIMPILAARGLTPLFDGVFAAESSKLENLKRIALAAKVDPHELAFVGDGEDDRLAAREFHCAFIAVGAGAGSSGAPPDSCIPDLVRLPQVLDDLNRRCA